MLFHSVIRSYPHSKEKLKEFVGLTINYSNNDNNRLFLSLFESHHMARATLIYCVTIRNKSESSVKSYHLTTDRFLQKILRFTKLEEQNLLLRN